MKTLILKIVLSPIFLLLWVVFSVCYIMVLFGLVLRDFYRGEIGGIDWKDFIIYSILPIITLPKLYFLGNNESLPDSI